MNPIKNVNFNLHKRDNEIKPIIKKTNNEPIKLKNNEYDLSYSIVSVNEFKTLIGANNFLPSYETDYTLANNYGTELVDGMLKVNVEDIFSLIPTDLTTMQLTTIKRAIATATKFFLDKGVDFMLNQVSISQQGNSTSFSSNSEEFNKLFRQLEAMLLKLPSNYFQRQQITSNTKSFNDDCVESNSWFFDNTMDDLNNASINDLLRHTYLQKGSIITFLNSITIQELYDTTTNMIKTTLDVKLSDDESNALKYYADGLYVGVNALDTYTKEQIDSKLSSKADTSYVNTQLALKANQTDLTTEATTRETNDTTLQDNIDLKQDKLPNSNANQYLTTNANNQNEWKDIPSSINAYTKQETNNLLLLKQDKLTNFQYSLTKTYNLINDYNVPNSSTGEVNCSLKDGQQFITQDMSKIVSIILHVNCDNLGGWYNITLTNSEYIQSHMNEPDFFKWGIIDNTAFCDNWQLIINSMTLTSFNVKNWYISGYKQNPKIIGITLTYTFDTNF